MTVYSAFSGFHNAGNGFEQGRFASAVCADNAEHVAFFKREGDVPVGPEFLHMIVLFDFSDHVIFQADRFEISGFVTNRNVL